MGMMMVHMEAARGVRLDPRQEVILTNLWLSVARRSNVVLLHENRWKQGLLLRLVSPLVDHFVWLQKMLELRVLWAWPLGRFRLRVPQRWQLLQGPKLICRTVRWRATRNSCSVVMVQKLGARPLLCCLLAVAVVESAAMATLLGPRRLLVGVALSRVCLGR